MLEAIRVRNWQSLRHVDLQLGRYTVIVGASSSGKTALMRAFRALASNVRGNTQITRGASSAAITAVLDDGTVTLEYTGGSWRYRIVLAGREESYTKLAGAVPEQITNILGIDPVPSGGTSINFAGQFDRPFLLSSDDSGAKVARAFGELTNVHVILGAVREANRRRASLASTVKVRQADLDRCVEALDRFRGLPARLQALKAAEEAHERAADTQRRIARLQALLDALETAERAATLVVLPEIPDVAPVEASYRRLRRLQQLVDRLGHAQAEVERCERALQQAVVDDQESRSAFREALAAAGECPTCGQTVTDRIQTVTSTL